MNAIRLLLCSSLLACFSVLADEVPAHVQQYCVQCHGVDGVASERGVPHLNGQQDTYLIDVITRFQRGKMLTGVAEHVPKSLDADAIEQIATYYSTRKGQRPKQETDPDKVARGETVFRNRCNDCHMDNGREADKDAPLVAGQSLDYLLAQTKLFVSGKRKFGYLQGDAFKGLSDDELEAAIHFFASQDQVAPKTVGKKKKR
jgi:sulfide dehydrogenase cytochrome subunit